MFIVLNSVSVIVPSAPPISVSVSEVTSSSITVQWGPVDCIHRNGDITDYQDSTHVLWLYPVIQLTSQYKVCNSIAFPSESLTDFPPATSPPSNATAVQTGSTSIIVSWSPSSDATGYRIEYESILAGSGSVDVSSTNINVYTLRSLTNGGIYNIFIVATSQHFPSVAVTKVIGLGKSG